MFDDARRMDNSGLKKNTRLVPPTKLPKYSEAANSNSANQIVAHDEKPATKCIGILY